MNGLGGPDGAGAGIVVVGGGHAGGAVLAQLRARGCTDRLVLLSAETALPYHRPPLSKKALGPAVSPQDLALRPATWYAEQSVEVQLGVRVLAIDRAARTVRLATPDGGEQSRAYDTLVLATGVAPRRLPASIGGTLDHVHTLRDATDAAALGQSLRDGRHLLVVGGGYVGLEVAASARRMGLEVTVVEQAPRILQRVAPEATAAQVRLRHEAQGVRVLEGAQLLGLDSAAGTGGPVRQARVLDAGGRLLTLPADVVVVGIGATPRDELARDAGLAVDNGILVDAQCLSSDPHIRAVGDVARLRGADGQGTIRLESVPNANEHAAVTADALTGGHSRCGALPWFWSDQFDHRLQIAGLWQGADQWVTRPEARGGVSVWSFAGGRLVAVDAIDAPLAFVHGRKWLEAGRGPDPQWLADPTRELKTWAPPVAG